MCLNHVINLKLDHYPSEEYKKWTRENFQYLSKDFRKLEISDKTIEKEIETDSYIEEEVDIEEELELEDQEEIHKKAKFLKSLKPIKNKIEKIYMGKILLKNDENNLRHTKESKAKLSEARRKRKVQPRTGTSKKAQTFSEQLKKDYKKDIMKNKKVEHFFRECKELYSNKEETKELGIMSDYQFSSLGFVEIGVEQMLFDPNGEKTFCFENTVDAILDYEIFEQDLNNTVARLREEDYSELFIFHYMQNKTKFFQMNYKLNHLLDSKIPELKDIIFNHYAKTFNEDFAEDLIINGVLDI